MSEFQAGAGQVLGTISFNMGNRQKHGLFEKKRDRELRKTELDCKKPRKIGHSCMLRGLVLGTLDMLFLLIIGLSLIVGSVGILNTMLMSTTGRFAEFGILRTNGWSRGDVLHLVLAESVCLGLLAGVLVCLLALGGVTAANRFLGHGLQLALTPGLLALGLGLAAALGTLGGSLPGLARLAPGADGDHPPGLAVSLG